MARRRFLIPRIAGLIMLGLGALLLYADLRSVHQIYRITQASIDKAADAETRQRLIANKEVRDREERRHKGAIAAILAIDVALFLWLGSNILRRPADRNAQQKLATGH